MARAAARLRFRPVYLLTLCALFVSVFPRSAAGQLEHASEYALKATFLYELTNFIQWPTGVFGNARDPLRIVIVGADPFGGALDRLIAARPKNQRGIVVLHGASGGTIPRGHMVFIAASEEVHLAKLLASYCQVPVLMVSDIHRFAERGGAIGFVMQDETVHLAINRTALEEARLLVSAQVLHLSVPLYLAISPCQ